MLGDNECQKRLIADFFANIGVAWFAAGVIGVFVGGQRSINDIFISLSWGIFFSFVFLSAGTITLKTKK